MKLLKRLKDALWPPTYWTPQRIQARQGMSEFDAELAVWLSFRSSMACTTTTFDATVR
jgi:hypothetical protein